MGLCELCSSIEEQSLDHDKHNGKSRRYTVYTHAPAQHGTLSTLETSVQQECGLCKQFWDSLTKQHKETMSSSEFAGVIVALFWDRKVASYTKLQYILGPEFDECGAVTDTFEMVPLKSGKFFTKSSEHHAC